MNSGQRHPAPRSHLELPFFDDAHRVLAQRLGDWCAIQDSGVHPSGRDAVDARCREWVTRLGRDGWLRHAVAGTRWGGAADAIDTRAICLLRETLAFEEGLADFAFAMQGLGSGAISLAGSEAQRARFLPRVAQGEAIAAFALSEPEAGSDVAAMQCSARFEGDHCVLEGEKTWISNGGIADFYVVFARTGEAPGARGISAFIVEADNPRLHVAERIDVIAPHPLARLRFDGCRVPVSARIGAAGEGFKIAMRTLDVFRTSVAAASLGFARRALAEGMHRARTRRMFGGVLADHQLTQAALSRMATTIDASALLTYRAAWMRDQGRGVTREAAMAKMAATEGAQQVIDAAVQMWGGMGVQSGNTVEVLYRDIRALRIYEGATEVQQLIIARDLMREADASGAAPSASASDSASGSGAGAGSGLAASAPTAHVDTFAADNLPPPDMQPEFIFDLPELQFPPMLNCADELLDRHVREGRGERVCVLAPGVRWTYRELQQRANRIANVLVHDLGMVPGQRVLLRAPNNPMLAAAWFGVVKAGGIAVATMPLLRAKELKQALKIARISHALCDAALREEMELARADAPELQHVLYFNGGNGNGNGDRNGDRNGDGKGSRNGSVSASPHAQGSPDSLDARMNSASADFANVNTAATDTCLLGFTSGTTGVPKATMHFHRDVMAACACWPKHVLRAEPDDVFIGSPPLAFTFGLGGMLLFPMAIGAATVLLEKASPPLLLEAIERFGATVLFTAPTTYRVLMAEAARLRGSKLRKCVSAGEALPAPTRLAWKEATGIELIDGIGSTEMLHIFISADEAHARPGATGVAVPGYRAEVVDDEGRPCAPGVVGNLRVKGPTGCRYLADERQRKYVRDGWNYTGDAYMRDADGYFLYQARTDDMIISSGYNIASPEVEVSLLEHPAVAECGVIGADDVERGQIVKAFVVLREGFEAGDALVLELQEHVKRSIAPYKYPRAIAFLDQMPRTATGKLQRFRLHDLEGK